MTPHENDADHIGDEGDTSAPGTEADETKRRFREALERKQHRRHATAEGAEHDGAQKSHGAQGPTKSRTFRRKSV
jgi:hypothetical protein